MSERKIIVEQVDNGYVVTGDDVLHTRTVYRTLDEVMNRLLADFEWRSLSGTGDQQGYVEVRRGPLTGSVVLLRAVLENVTAQTRAELFDDVEGLRELADRWGVLK